MRRSIERIITTHAGSLPRPDDLTQLMWEQAEGKPVDQLQLGQRVKQAVAEVVEHQLAVGLDVVSDGEMSKPGFSNYIGQRLSGFEASGPRKFVATDIAEVPGLGRRAGQSEAQRRMVMPACVGPIAVRDREAVKVDIANFKAALAGRDLDLAFIPAVTPSHLTFNFPNHYYGSFEAYLAAAADALSYEYEAIVAAGFNLQLDSPDLAMAGHSYSDGDAPVDLQKYVPVAIEAINHAIRNLPPEKVRLHLCWGNYAGPHHKDTELRRIIEPVLKTRAGFIYVEGANPRHEHEWEVWREVKLPAGKALIVGMIDTVTNHVEHPRVVAQRLERYAGVVGKENVIAATDCGFGTFVGWSNCDPQVAWLKLEALVAGARLASEELW